MDVTPITPAQLLTIIGFVVAVWGFVKVVKEIIEAINSKHDQEQKWDSYDHEITEVKKSIEDNQTDMAARIQEIKTEQCMLTFCMMATLDGLHQLGCNGKVTEARDKLDKHLNKAAHNVE